MPERIQRRRTLGWRMPDDAWYVGRPSIFGNPFTVKGAREAGYRGSDRHLQGWCVIRYRDWLAGTEPEGLVIGLRDRRAQIIEAIPLLRGKDLACWCKIYDENGHWPCHADILLGLANR